MRRWTILGLFLLAVPCYAQLPASLTTQEAIWPGSTHPGTRPALSPVTVGIPLRDSDGITGAIGTCPTTLQVRRSGSPTGTQCRILNKWASGNAKWVLFDFQDTVSVGSVANDISIVKVASGGGNTGTNMATTGGGLITINTGVVTFTINQTGNFNLLQSVVVGSTTLVSTHGVNDGLVLAGPTFGLSLPDSVSCAPGPNPSNYAGTSTCPNLYLSNNDSAATCAIEENGALRVSVKCTGNFVDGASNVYMHWTCREFFFAGQSYVWVQPILRNADLSTVGNDFPSAYKEYQYFDARLTVNLSSFFTGNRTVTFATDTGTSAQTFTSTSDSAYIYQAYSSEYIGAYLNGKDCTAAADECVVSKINRTGTPGTYAQNGWMVVKNGTSVANGGLSTYPTGWADEVDGAGNGVEIGTFLFSATWPKALEFYNGGTEVRIGLDPDQTLCVLGSQCVQQTGTGTTTGPQGNQSYVRKWPGYEINEGFLLNFHVGALANQADAFLDVQHPLIARAPFTYYNGAVDQTTGIPALLYPLPDPVAEDTYYKNAGFTTHICPSGTVAGQCESDIGSPAPRIAMTYDWLWFWTSSGGGNQHDFAWSYLRNWFQRGGTGVAGSLPGRYVRAGLWYHMVAETGFAMSDGFKWKDQCVPTVTIANCKNLLSTYGSPNPVLTEINAGTQGEICSADTCEHAHWYGLIDYYLATGKEYLKDIIINGAKNNFYSPLVALNNPAASVNPNHGAWDAPRSVGHREMGWARMSMFLRSIGDPDADTTGTETVLVGADNAAAFAVAYPLTMSGFGDQSLGSSYYTGCNVTANTYDYLIGGTCPQGVSPVRGLNFQTATKNNLPQIQYDLTSISRNGAGTIVTATTLDGDSFIAGPGAPAVTVQSVTPTDFNTGSSNPFVLSTANGTSETYPQAGPASEVGQGLNCSITNIGVASNIVTAQCTNTFSVNQVVTFRSLTFGSILNSHNIKCNSSTSGSQIVGLLQNFTTSDFTAAATTGNAYNTGSAGRIYGNEARIGEALMHGILNEGLYEYNIAKVDLFGKNWLQSVAITGAPNGTMLIGDERVRDLMYGAGNGIVREAMVNTGSQGTSGISFYTYPDYINSTGPCITGGDCSRICTAGKCDSTDHYFNFHAIAENTCGFIPSCGSNVDLNGNQWQQVFEYNLGKSDTNGAIVQSMFGHHLQAVVNDILLHNPTNPNSYPLAATAITLQPVTITSGSPCVGPTGSGTVNCTVTWTIPANLTSVNGVFYKLKYYACATGASHCPKTIESWIGFHPNCFTTSVTAECTTFQPGGLNPCAASGVNASDNSGCFEGDPNSFEAYHDAQNVPDLILCSTVYPPSACGNPIEPTSGNSYFFTAQHDVTYTFALWGYQTQGATPASSINTLVH